MNLTNAIIYMFMAIACSFGYYLINFYVKYLPGSIYTNQVVNSLAESGAHAASVIVVTVLSVKRGFSTAFVICMVACVMVIFAEMYNSSWMIPVSVLFAKAGISVAFCFLYFSTVNYFPSAYLGFVMGFCNVAGSSSTIAAPIIAEMRDPIPMMTTIVLCFLAFIGSLNLKQPEELKQSQNQADQKAVELDRQN